jgi:DNA polymerase I
MEHDKTFSKLLILKAKKRYAGYLTYIDGKDIPSQLYVKGLEYVRTDSCKVLKQEQKSLIEKCLDGQIPESKMKDLIHNLRNFVLYELKDVEMIKIAQKLTKEVEDYTVDLAHLKVVEQLRNMGVQVYVGDKIEYFIESQDREGKPVPKAVRFFDGKFDRLYFWSKKLYPALERILESVFPNTDWSRYKDFGSAKKMANSKQGRMNLW